MEVEINKSTVQELSRCYVDVTQQFFIKLRGDYQETDRAKIATEILTSLAALQLAYQITKDVASEEYDLEMSVEVGTMPPFVGKKI